MVHPGFVWFDTRTPRSLYESTPFPPAADRSVGSVRLEARIPSDAKIEKTFDGEKESERGIQRNSENQKTVPFPAVIPVVLFDVRV